MIPGTVLLLAIEHYISNDVQYVLLQDEENILILTNNRLCDISMEETELNCSVLVQL